MKQILALLLLSLLWGVEWLREFLIIPHTPASLRSAIGLTIAAILSSLLPSQRRITKTGLLAAVGLFAMPTLLLAFVHVSGYTSATLWTLAPVLVVVLCGARSAGLRHDMLFTALAGVAGALLVFPIQFPASLADAANWLVVLGAVALAAGSSVIAADAEGMSTSGVALAALVLWGAAALSGGLSLTIPELLWIAAVDLPAILLLLWLLRQMRPEALAARYLLPLVVTILSSWIALHQQMSLQFGAGLVLMTAASALLIYQTRENMA